MMPSHLWVTARRLARWTLPLLLLLTATACAPRCRTLDVPFTWYAADGSIARIGTQTYTVCRASR